MYRPSSKGEVSGQHSDSPSLVAVTDRGQGLVEEDGMDEKLDDLITDIYPELGVTIGTSHCEYGDTQQVIYIEEMKSDHHSSHKRLSSLVNILV